ncbi:MAG: class I SAM-dependent methyltransferase [Chloroflexota bacterium]|nr:class I SAM-dependent methyltransferase [Chloroflexota bacterium]
MKRETLSHNAIFSDEAFAQKYAQNHQKMAVNLGEEYVKKLTARGFTTGKILDSGCGFGITDVVIAQHFPGCEVIGIDLSAPLLEMARASASEAKVSERVTFQSGDVQQIAYADNSFDVVLNINMAHLVNEPLQMLNEIERVLSPGGFLFIADLRRSWLGIFEQEIKSAFSNREAEDLIDRSKLRQGVFSSSMIWWRYEA